MSQDINNLLDNWVGNYVTKQGALLPRIGNFLAKTPSTAWRASKIAIGAGIVGAAGEASVRTLNNVLHGNPDLAPPTFSENQLGTLVSSAANLSGFRPLLQASTQAVADGLDMSPNAQKWLDGAANVTNPQVRKQILDDTIRAANTGGKALAQNVGNVAGEAVGKSLGRSLASGMYSDMLKHPVLTLGGAALFGAGPAIAYDSVTYKRRKEEAERNKAILRYINKQEKIGMLKDAGVGSYLMNALRRGEQLMPGMKGTPKADKLEQLYSKYVFRPTGSSHEKLNEVLKKFEGKGVIPNSALDKAKGFPQTLGNNSLTRNPVKTALGASAGLGTGITAAQAGSPDPKYNGMYDTRPQFIKNWVKNMAVIPGSLLKATELSTVKGIHIIGTTVDKLQNIKYNLMSGDKTPPVSPPNDPNYMPQHFGLSDKTIEHLKNDDIVGVKPPVTNDKTSWRDIVPYASAAGLLALPLPTYMMYRRYADKKLNKLEGDTAKLQQKTELANQQNGV